MTTYATEEEMTDAYYSSLLFDDCPLIWNTLSVPLDNHMLFRAAAHDPLDTQSSGNPLYFGEYAVAEKYFNRKPNERKVWGCVLKKDTKLMHIKAMRWLFLETLIEQEQQWNEEKKTGPLSTEKDREYTGFINNSWSFMVSYGLVPHKIQLAYTCQKYAIRGEVGSLPQTYTRYLINKSMQISPSTAVPASFVDSVDRPGLLKPYGSRISYCPVDDQAVAFMRDTFYPVATLEYNTCIHGYMCPRWNSPWHAQGFDAEIVLFQPKKSLSGTMLLRESGTNQIDISSFISTLDVTSSVYKVYHDKWTQQNMFTEAFASYAAANQFGGRSKSKKKKQRGGTTYIKGTVPLFLSTQDIPVQDNNSTEDLTNVDKTLELMVEKGKKFKYSVHCDISNMQLVRKFVITVFAKVGLLCKEALEFVFQSNGEKMVKAGITLNDFRKENLLKHFGPEYGMDDKGTIYLLKPGLPYFTRKNGSIVNNNATSIVDVLISKNTVDDIVTELMKLNGPNKVSLSEYMGAVYGIIIHAGWFNLFCEAALTSSTINLAELKGPVENVIAYLKGVFGLDKSMDSKLFLQLIQKTHGFAHVKLEASPATKKEIIFNPPKGDMNNVFFEIMMSFPNASARYNIVKKNLNNQTYIRKRTAKLLTGTYKHTTVAPKCPRFFKTDESVLMIDGNEWYTVTEGGFFDRYMKMYGRTSKAGPSGSTFLWINMCFEMIRLEPSAGNVMALLLAILSDFVPYYHSFSEVLLIFSIEMLNYSKFLPARNYDFKSIANAANAAKRITQAAFKQIKENANGNHVTIVNTKLQSRTKEVIEQYDQVIKGSSKPVSIGEAGVNSATQVAAAGLPVRPVNAVATTGVQAPGFYSEADLYTFDQNPVTWLRKFVYKFMLPDDSAIAHDVLLKGHMAAIDLLNKVKKKANNAASAAQNVSSDNFDPNNMADDYYDVREELEGAPGLARPTNDEDQQPASAMNAAEFNNQFTKLKSAKTTGAKRYNNNVALSEWLRLKTVLEESLEYYAKNGKMFEVGTA